MPYIFTATEDIIIDADGKIKLPVTIEDGVPLTYSLQNCTIEFYRIGQVDSYGLYREIYVDTIEHSSTYYFVIIPFDGYVVEDVKVNGADVYCPYSFDAWQLINIEAVAVLPEYSTLHNFSLFIVIEPGLTTDYITTDMPMPGTIELSIDNPSQTYAFETSFSNGQTLQRPPYQNHCWFYNVIFGADTITFELSPYLFSNQDLWAYYYFDLVLE